MDPFPEEWQLLSFFESEPDVLDAGVPWAYNTLTFRTQRGPNQIQCRIEPGYETLRFTWSVDDSELMDLQLRWVSGIVIATGGGEEVLTGWFRSEEVMPFVLRLKPAVHVHWGTSNKL